MQLRTPCKEQIMLGLLASGYVQVYADPRRPGVVLPTAYTTQSHVRLDYGDLLPNPPEDLVVDETGIGGLLAFDHTLCRTFLPWSAVYYMESPVGARVVWPADAPPELQEQQVVSAVAAAVGGGAAPTQRVRPDWLKVV